MTEKFVDTLCKGIHTLLLQSNCPPEFWGAAAHYYTDVYKHTPHTSINNQIPYNIHHSAHCDMSWFRPFGCHTTLFRCKDIMEHHKLAPCCEQGVMVGLETDQHIYCFYDNQAITRPRADAYGNTQFQDILNMPLPEQPSCATCDFDPITDNHFPMCNTIDVDAYADRNNATDNVAKQVYGDIHNCDYDCDYDIVTDNVTDTDGTESSWKRVRDHWGDKAAGNSWGKGSGARDATAAPDNCMGNGHCWGSENSWGNENRRGPNENSRGAEPTVPAPSVGVFRLSKHPRFGEAPGKYGSAPKLEMWFDCEMQAIADTSYEDLAEYLIGH
eukprot:85762-Rhodomonas_salina.1